MARSLSRSAVGPIGALQGQTRELREIAHLAHDRKQGIVCRAEGTGQPGERKLTGAGHDAAAGTKWAEFGQVLTDEAGNRFGRRRFGG